MRVIVDGHVVRHHIADMATVVASEMDAKIERRQRAVLLTKKLVELLGTMGVSAKVIGSLPTARFNEHSDIDLLITHCPRQLKYRIEGIVEDALPGFKFDVVYLDEIPPHRIHRFTEGQVDASDLR